MAVSLPIILALLAAPSVWDVTSLNPPIICQVTPAPVCIARDARVLLIWDDRIEVIPEPGGLTVWRQANQRVADAAALRRDRAERRMQGQRQ